MAEWVIYLPVTYSEEYHVEAETPQEALAAVMYGGIAPGGSIKLDTTKYDFDDAQVCKVDEEGYPIFEIEVYGREILEGENPWKEQKV